MLRIFVLVLSASLVFACSSSPPSADEVCTKAEEKLCSDDPGEPHADCIIELDALHKTATDKDCSTEYDDYVQCVVDAFDSKVVCGNPDTDNADDFCDPKEELLDTCLKK